MKDKIITIMIFISLTWGSLLFVNWICQMAFENTCIELEEQHIVTEVNEIIGSIEDSLNFGKELGNYYGIDEVIEKICACSEGNLKAIVTDKNGDPLYLSFGKSEENIQDLTIFYSNKYKEELLKVEKKGNMVEFGEKTSLIYPILKNEKQIEGYIIIIYNEKSLMNQTQDISVYKVMLLLLGIVIIVLMVVLFLIDKKNVKDVKRRYVPIAIIMAAMFAYIAFLFTTYRENYNELVRKKAEDMAISIQNTMNELVEKGLTVEELYRVDNYLEEKENTMESIKNIEIVTDKKSIDTGSNVTKDKIYLDIAGGQAVLDITINQSYIKKKINTMTLTFGAVFVVCMMITYELMQLVELISIRVSKKFNQKCKEQFQGISTQIRLISFLSYTAIYTSMPYAAVIMRKWDAQVFGLSNSVSASLPLTVELVSVLVASTMIQKVFHKLKIRHYIRFIFPYLILGNLACMMVDSPYLLIGLRAICGIGFAFLKYWLNIVVAAGSEDNESISTNCGKLNAGLLGGITVGASLGAILAEALGYQSNYIFTAIILCVLFVGSIIIVPWKLLEQMRNTAMSDVETQKKKKENTKKIYKNPKLLSTLLLGCIPLNIGLMYVVAFIPSYMATTGKPAIATSYVYLVNGLAGVYLGLVVLNLLKKKSLFFSATLALFTAAGGMLVLLINQGVGVIMISAGILGLFDGFGTPSITSYFTSISTDSTQTTEMLTIFNILGSAVQILCPMLYNMLIQPNGETTYLMIFGLLYLVVAILFMFVNKQGEIHKQLEE